MTTSLGSLRHANTLDARAAGHPRELEHREEIHSLRERVEPRKAQCSASRVQSRRSRRSYRPSSIAAHAGEPGGAGPCPTSSTPELNVLAGTGDHSDRPSTGNAVNAPGDT